MAPRRKQDKKNILPSDESSDSEDELRRSRPSGRLRPSAVHVEPSTSELEANDNQCFDFYDDQDVAYLKMADEVVDKNVKHSRLFDPALMDGFYSLLQKTTKVGQSTRVIEACYKVFGHRVDAVFNQVHKLNSDFSSRVENRPNRKIKIDEATLLNTSCNEWANDDVANDSAAGESLFSGEEDVDDLPTNKAQSQRLPQVMSAEMTMMTPFDGNDVTMANHAAGLNDSFGNSFTADGSTLAEKMNVLALDRSVLVGRKIRSLDDFVKRFQRANAAAMDLMQKHKMKKMTAKTAKKEMQCVEEPGGLSNHAMLDVPLYHYAVTKKQEKRHVPFDDVAATNDDCSIVFMHNEWSEKEDKQTKLCNEIDDWGFFDDDWDADGDVVGGVLEQIQGTLENATSSQHKLEPEWIDILGLEKRDLKRVIDHEAYSDVSFENTANDDIDPDKRLVDRIVIPGEEDAVKHESDRFNALLKELYSQRVMLPGGPGHPEERKYRIAMNRPDFCPMYDDEDAFFNYDLRKYLTKETIESEVAESRNFLLSVVEKSDLAVKMGFPSRAFQYIMRDIRNSPNSFLSSEAIEHQKTIPKHIIFKLLIDNSLFRHRFVDEAAFFTKALLPFRMIRYVQALVGSVVHQANKSDINLVALKKASFFSSRATSVMGSVTPSKVSRIDDTCSEGFLYFMAKELKKTKRYPNQVTYDDMGSTIRSICIERLQKAPLELSVCSKLDGFYALLDLTGFFIDHSNLEEDLSCLEIVDNLFDVEEVASILTEVEDTENLQFDQSNVQGNCPSFDFNVPLSTSGNHNDDAMETNSLPSQYEDCTLVEPVNEISQDMFACQDDKSAALGAASPNCFNDMQAQISVNDSLANLIDAYDDSHRANTHSAKPINFVEDNAHWGGKGESKKGRRRKVTDKEEEIDDALKFAPRTVMANITTTRRGRTPSKESIAWSGDFKKISRSNDTSLPDSVDSNFAFRMDDVLSEFIPGFGNPDHMFIATPYEYVKNITNASFVRYQGEYSYLPPTALTRQSYDIMFWTKFHYYNREIERLAGPPHKRTSGVSDRTLSVSDGEDFCDALEHPTMEVDVDFNGDVSTRHSRMRIDDFRGEFGQLSDGDDDEDEGGDEYENFDFDAEIDKQAALQRFSHQGLRLKRAIRYILTRSSMDRTSVPDHVWGILSAPNVDLQKAIKLGEVAISTPHALKGERASRFLEDMADDVILNSNATVGTAAFDPEDEPQDGDTDQTKVKDFKVQGFHTLRSLLYHLPAVCCAETVELLSVSHVMVTLCIMANENSLALKQDFRDEEADSVTDSKILNIEDVELVPAILEDGDFSDDRNLSDMDT